MADKTEVPYCFVPTHSLINYSSWQIVSPEASLTNLQGMDGYIAQVWTGTSREAVYFNGTSKERVFENAFLEYGSMVSMTVPTGRKLFFLTDPIEDRPKSWDDYKVNYEATFTAQLLYPGINNYEVMPWPSRIYEGKFKVEGSDEKQSISQSYATQMQVMVNSLNSMPQSSNKVNGSKGIAVLLSNSMMFQRFPTHKGYDDPQLSNFYGMALPLLKRGIPVETVHIENLSNRNTLKDIKVLIMSYANMKPLSAHYHTELVKWIQNGGVLVYYGRDNDPFQTVKEWWNTGGNKFKSPSEHLFSLLKINEKEGQNEYACAAGKVFIVRKDPKELVMEEGADKSFISYIKKAYENNAKAGRLIFKNNFMLDRGPYKIAAVLNENDNRSALKLTGSFIDLFDPELPVLNTKNVEPGTQAYLYDLSKIAQPLNPQVLAAAARVYNETITGKKYSFIVKSPSETMNAMRIKLPEKPKKVEALLNNMSIAIKKNEWDAGTRTLMLGFQNHSEGVQVTVEW